MMLPMVLPGPRSSASPGTGAVCFFAHAGSASMASGLSVGALPSKVMVPVMVDAAKATPGYIDDATSPATRHNLFPVQRMLRSFALVFVSAVMANVISVSPVDAANLSNGGTLHRTRLSAQPCQRRKSHQLCTRFAGHPLIF